MFNMNAIYVILFFTAGYVAHAGIDRRIDLKPPVHTKPHWSSLGTPFKAHPGHGYEELMARLREHVVRNQIRVWRVHVIVGCIISTREVCVSK